MKKTLSQRFFLPLCLLTLFGILGGSHAWAEELTIDFESVAKGYPDWTFVNMLSKETGAITAKGGTYYGTTGGKTTASITTKTAIPYPTSISFYVSKQSSNTKSSSWKIQVSSNNSTWTDVKTQSATSMTQGSWVEVTQDLSSYNNVYVRIYYTGSTAVRNIDDVTLTYSTSVAPLKHYTVNWMVNGNPYSEGTPSTDVAEGESVETLPTTPAAIGDKVFMGWTNATIDGTQDDAPAVLFTSAAEAPTVTANTTYYAVFATQSGSGPVESLIQTLVYDTWTYSGSTTNKSSYRLFHTDSYIESETFDLSKLTKVVVYGGTFGGSTYNKLNIGDGTNTWKEGTVTGKSETGVNTFTGGTALSGEGKLRITSKSGTASSTGVRISKVEIYTTEGGYTYSAYATNFATLSNRNLVFSETAVDYFEAPFTAPTLSGHTEGVTYASSDMEVATVKATTGEITIGTKYGTTTITASAEQSGSYYADETSYTISVWPSSISGLKTLITSESEIDFKVKLNNAVITYADEKNAYLQDADAAILIYVKGHGLTEGKSYTGVASGKAKLYNGLREITSIDWGTIIPEDVVVPAAQTVTLAELNANYDKYESMYVTVQNATVTSALSSRNATISQDSEEYNVYDKNNGLSATALSTANAIANVVGFPGKFNTTLQLNVFNNIDVEETGYNLVVSAAGYATYFNSTEAFTMPAGATGYVWNAGNIAGVYDPAADVPANEPLVIKAAAGNYALWFTSSTEETYKSYGMNELEGTDVETAIPDDDAYFYGLSLNASHDPASVGFYWMNATGAAFTNGAHKAYLKLDKSTPAGSQAVNGFPFNGTTTGIEQIEAGADAKNAIYDLSGRRVNKAAKGIYILNGKKVLVK